jgi:hypothetical protein
MIGRGTKTEIRINHRQSMTESLLRKNRLATILPGDITRKFSSAITSTPDTSVYFDFSLLPARGIRALSFFIIRHN